jgi:hypothetical protein
MKLAEISMDVLHTEIIDGDEVSFVYNINEGMFDVRQVPIGHSTGGFVKGIKDVGKLMTNPFVVGMAVAYAEKAYKKYKRDKKYTARFFSKVSEKAFYEKIIAELMKTGHYEKVKRQDVDGGYIWELERKDY